MSLSQGTILTNRYRIVKPLGMGGFGVVYRAWDISFEMPCALKENIETSPEAQRQFLREAKILRTLRHPNLPQVTDYFSIPEQGQYLVNDFVEGEDLQEMLEKAGGPLLEAQVLPWIGQVCAALAYLHTQKPPIIHRDIKPANLRLAGSPGSLSSGPQSRIDNQESKIFLVDFGIAKLFDPSLSTTLGARAVTPGYSPYEQYGQGSTDARSDLYALDATLFTLLTGCVPPESIHRMLRDPLQPAEHLNPNLSPQTIAALHKALQVDPDLRFQTALEFKAATSFQPILSSSQPVALDHLFLTPPSEYRISKDRLDQAPLTGTVPTPAGTQTLAPSRPRSFKWLV